MNYELRGIIYKDKAVITELFDNDFREVIWKNQELPSQIIETDTCVEATLITYNGLWKDPKKYFKSWSLYTSPSPAPSWFRKDHRKMFRLAADAWWTEHVLVQKEISHLSSGFFYLKECNVKTISGDTCVICDGSKIGTLKDTSVVLKAFDCSAVNHMQDQSLLRYLMDHSTIYYADDSSKIERMTSTSMINNLQGNATVSYMDSYSRILTADDHSRISVMRGNSLIHSMAKESIVEEMLDYSFVAKLVENARVNEFSGRHAVIPLDTPDPIMPFN